MSESTITTTAEAGVNAGRHYQVIVTGYSVVVVVDAEDEEEAMRCAIDVISTGDFQVDECRVESELKTPEELAIAKREADCVYEDE